MKKIIFAFLSLTIGILVFGMMRSNTVQSSEAKPDLILTVATDKETYILGERINLQFELRDKNDKTFTLRTLPTVEVGYMQVWLAAASDKNFKKYQGAGWGFSEGSKPWTGESFKSTAEILWNGKPFPNGPPPDDQIITEYPIMEPGVYLIKATAIIFLDGIKSDIEKIIIESEPVQIIVNQPVGDDLAVWNEIKNNDDFGSFMRNGAFLYGKKPEETQKLLEKIEMLISKYPNSLLVSQIKQGHKRFLENQEVIKQSREEVKKDKAKKP